MKLVPVLCALFLLASCGRGSPASKTDAKSDAKSDAAASSKTGELVKTPESALKTPEAVKTPEPVVKTTSAVPAKTEPATPAKTLAAPPPALLPTGKLSGFEKEDVGGKPIGTWVTLLGSQKKEEVLEAIEYCRMVDTKASSGIPKLTELTKSPDKEIADAAAEALKRVKK